MTLKRFLIEQANRVLRPLDTEIVRRSDVWRSMSLLGTQPAVAPSTGAADKPPYHRVFADKGEMSGGDFAFSVVMPTVLRDTLPQALHSIFAQDLPGKIETLIGVDAPLGAPEAVEYACRERPENHEVVLFYPGYSTSVRHGGLHPAWDGGGLRIVLSYLARSRRIAYLDDDNWWSTNHLSSMAAALQGNDWAWSQRWFVHPSSRKPICVDEWESTGPGGNGTFAHLGGWVDPNCLALDKIASEAVLRWWGIPVPNCQTGRTADRNVFRILKDNFRAGSTDQPSVFYTLNERDYEQPQRVASIGEARYRAAGHCTKDPATQAAELISSLAA
jgi:hypothetical protein